MEKTVSAFEARRQFGSLLNGVDARGDKVVVTRHGEPVAALVPISILVHWRQQREDFLEMWDRLESRNVDLEPLTEDEAMEIALEAVAAVRAEMRAERDAERQAEREQITRT